MLVMFRMNVITDKRLLNPGDDSPTKRSVYSTSAHDGADQRAETLAEDVMCLDELSLLVRRSRRIFKDSSSRRIMRPVPVFILRRGA